MLGFVRETQLYRIPVRSDPWRISRIPALDGLQRLSSVLQDLLLCKYGGLYTGVVTLKLHLCTISVFLSPVKVMSVNLQNKLNVNNNQTAVP